MLLIPFYAGPPSSPSHVTMPSFPTRRCTTDKYLSRYLSIDHYLSIYLSIYLSMCVCVTG